MKSLVDLSELMVLIRVEKVLPPGFEPATYRSRSRHAIPFSHLTSLGNEVERLYTGEFEIGEGVSNNLTYMRWEIVPKNRSRMI